jgi:hypothetical protein
VTAVTSFSGATATPGVSATVTLIGSATCSLVNPQFIALNQVPPPGRHVPVRPVRIPGHRLRLRRDDHDPDRLLAGDPAGAQYWKFGPTPGDANPHWYQLPGATLVGNTATFSITDGQIGDDDLTANGTIVDQGGPAIFAPVITAPSIPIPALSASMLMVLMLVAAGTDGFALRRRKHRADRRAEMVIEVLF